MPSISLTEKYRPKTLQDLVLSPQHGLAASLEFCRSPYASAWLHHGKSGLGKSSLAEIMARVASNPLCIHRYGRPRFDLGYCSFAYRSFHHPSPMRRLLLARRP